MEFRVGGEEEQRGEKRIAVGFSVANRVINAHRWSDVHRHRLSTPLLFIASSTHYGVPLLPLPLISITIYRSSGPKFTSLSIGIRHCMRTVSPSQLLIVIARESLVRGRIFTYLKKRRKKIKRKKNILAEGNARAFRSASIGENTKTEAKKKLWCY